MSGLQKPLPPVPLQVKRPQDHADGRFPPMPMAFLRRSSSIYSEDLSDEWELDAASWKSSDLADSTIFLQPTTYTPNPPARVGQSNMSSAFPSNHYPVTTPEHHQRPYPTTNKPPPKPLHPFPLSLPSPPPHPSPSSPKPLFKTISLEKAWETMKAPGAQQLLPEELRARAIQRAAAAAAYPNPPPKPLPPHQKRHQQPTTAPRYTPPSSSHQYSTPLPPSRPLSSSSPLQPPQQSKAAQALGLGNLLSSHTPPPPPLSSSSSLATFTPSGHPALPPPSPRDEAVAQEYHSFLRAQYSTPSPPPSPVAGNPWAAVFQNTLAGLTPERVGGKAGKSGRKGRESVEGEKKEDGEGGGRGRRGVVERMRMMVLPVQEGEYWLAQEKEERRWKEEVKRQIRVLRAGERGGKVGECWD